MGEYRVMRVTVRGRFGRLSARALDYLRSNLDQHDVYRSEYTVEGTLTYDTVIDYFSIRYEIRVGDNDPDIAAIDRGIAEARRFLTTMDFDHRSLCASATDAAAAWHRHATNAVSTRSTSDNRVTGPASPTRE
jgi:Family of unknown function (DUF6204)